MAIAKIIGRAVCVGAIALVSVPAVGAGRWERLSDEYFVPAAADSSPASEPLTRFRGKCDMQLFADRGASVEVRLTAATVSPRYTQEMSFTIESPDGKRVCQGSLKPKESKT